MASDIAQADNPRAAARQQQRERRQALALVNLGQHLREYRELVRRQSQQQAAEAMGISRGTLASMEGGGSGVAIGAWVAAWDYMGRLDFFVALTHDEHQIADATAKLLQERAAAVSKKRADKGGPRNNT